MWTEYDMKWFSYIYENATLEEWVYKIRLSFQSKFYHYYNSEYNSTLKQRNWVFLNRNITLLLHLYWLQTPLLIIRIALWHWYLCYWRNFSCLTLLLFSRWPLPFMNLYRVENLFDADLLLTISSSRILHLQTKIE